MVIADDHYVVHEYRLEILNATDDDAGNYTCRAEVDELGNYAERFISVAVNSESINTCILLLWNFMNFALWSRLRVREVLFNTTSSALNCCEKWVFTHSIRFFCRFYFKLHTSRCLVVFRALTSPWSWLFDLIWFDLAPILLRTLAWRSESSALSACCAYTGVPRWELGGLNPHWIFIIFLNCVFAKYTV